MKRLSAIWFLLLTVLLPVKFGGLAVMPEASAYFPPHWLDYLLITWPVPVFGIAAAIALILNLAARGFRLPPYRNRQAALAGLWGIGLILLAIPGFIHAPGLDFAMLMVPHLTGIGMYVLAAWLYFTDDPAARDRWLGALTAGTLLAIAAGAEQYLWGFERARQFFLEQEKAGVIFPEALRLRTFDTRVYGTFAGCNSLAGWLLLTLPLTVPVLIRWAGHVEPVKWSKRLFLLAGTGGGLAILLLTRSRAGFLAMAVTAGLMILLLPLKRGFRLLLMGAVLAAVLGGAAYIRLHGRGFDSMAARADYLRSSVLLLADHPLTGCGWGGFYTGHLQRKTIPSGEAAHDPHNLLMAAAQAGIPMMLGMAAAFLLPLGLLFRQWQKNDTDRRGILPAMLGLTLFFLHSLMDIDLLIPGLMAAAAALTVWSIPPSGTAEPHRGLRPAGILLLLFAVTAGAAQYATLRGEMALDDLISAAAERSRDIDTPRKNASAWRPWSSYPWSIAADSIAARGDWETADRWYSRAQQLAPERPDLCRRRAEMNRLLGRADIAAEQAERARRLFPLAPRHAHSDSRSPIN